MQYQYCIVSYSLQSNAMPLLTQSPVELVGLALDEQIHAFMLVEQLLTKVILKSLERLVGGLSGFRNGLALASCRVGLDQMLELGVIDVICGGPMSVRNGARGDSFSRAPLTRCPLRYATLVKRLSIFHSKAAESMVLCDVAARELAVVVND